MKHTTLLFSVFVFAALAVMSTVHAEDTKPASDDNVMEGRMKDQRGWMVETDQERTGEFRDELRARFDEFRMTRISGMIEMMKKRFAWAIERLENIADRIEMRIEKIEGETGETLTDARHHLDEARTDIGEATKLLSEIDTDVDNLTADETKAGERFSTFRGAFGAVKEEIKSAWTHLREALAAIKGERDERRDDKTTTTD